MDIFNSKIRCVLDQNFMDSIVTLYKTMSKKVATTLSVDGNKTSAYNHKMLIAYCNAATLFIAILSYGKEAQKLCAIKQMNGILKTLLSMNSIMYSKLCYFLVESEYTHYLLLE